MQIFDFLGVTIDFSQYTITPELNLTVKKDDFSQILTLTTDEVKKYSLKQSYIVKMINEIKKDLISYKTNRTLISELLEL